VTVKINVDQVGCPTSNGVSALRDVIAKSDSPVVTNLQKAGAVIIGRTNTQNSHFGEIPTMYCTGVLTIPGDLTFLQADRLGVPGQR